MPPQETIGAVDADPGARLLAGYRKGDTYFATSRRTLLGTGVTEVFREHTVEALAGTVEDRLHRADVPLALGMLPFDVGGSPATPCQLVVPTMLSIAGPVLPTAAGGERSRVPLPAGIRAVPTESGHMAAVGEIVARIKNERLRKAVLARMLELDFDETVYPEPILRNLVRDNPRGYRFAMETPHGTTLLGASPELLLSRRGERVRSHPLAGSAPRSADPRQDNENAAALRRSTKDMAEHALVTEAVVEGLRPFCRGISAPTEPELVATPTMWHLGTVITGTLRDTDTSAVRLAGALHPTPAVCGTPPESARRLLGELEPFDRGYYAGAVGWVDGYGDGEWAVTIRCTEVTDSTMRLFAGGGIVAASDPASELAETTAKFETLLRAMGLEREA